ncbi:hypothetical protein diail_10601, partial [Diaporthe ilicicola]
MAEYRRRLLPRRSARLKRTPQKLARVEMRMMMIANDMQSRTKAFTIESKTEPERILDLSVVPSGLLAYALGRNRKAHALAFSLPEADGGFAPSWEESEAVRVQQLDITLLVADMGLKPEDVPESDPDADRYRHSRYFVAGHSFDLAIRDSSIEPTWGMFRGSREYRRRLLTQLVLGLEHLHYGGTMIVQLYKLEGIQTIRLLLQFAGFAEVRIFKNTLWVGKLASFYLVATKVQSISWRARTAVEEWKREWKVITLGNNQEWREQRDRLAGCGDQSVEGFLKEIGPTLLNAGSYIWQKQLDALAELP